jgi:selenocysteine-specific elongation factor
LLETLTRQAVACLKACQQCQPAPGYLTRELLRGQIGIGEKAFGSLVAYWVKARLIAVHGPEVILAEYANSHENWQQELAAAARAVLAGGELVNITAEFLGQQLNLPGGKAKAAFDRLVRDGILIKAGEVVFYYQAVDNVVGILREYFQTQETITVAQLRDKLKTTRKFALPLLEYCDLHKYTIRHGDFRLAGPSLN